MAFDESSRNKAARHVGLIVGEAIFILLCVVTALGPTGWWRDFSLWQFGDSGNAVITRAVLNSDIASQEYDCDYRFEYNGTWYGIDRHVDSCIEGATVPVRYMSSDPTISSIRPPFSGRALSLAIIALLSVLGGGAAWARTWDSLQRESRPS